MNTPVWPTPAEICLAREFAGLYPYQAAELLQMSESGWLKWEGGEARMRPALWELFRIKLMYKFDVDVETKWAEWMAIQEKARAEAASESDE